MAEISNTLRWWFNCCCWRLSARSRAFESLVEEGMELSGTTRQEPMQVQELPEVKKQEEEVRVDLEDPAALARFLVTANIKLVRAEYLVHLITEDRRLPRRQEAETAQFVDRAGKTRSALVNHEEIQAWAAGSKEAIIASVSHAWEAREHPDPCGHQLERVVSHAALFVAAFAADVWLFFDYVSLFQFKRQKEAEEQSFRRSMGNMHAMYAHESTMTFRLEGLTPEHRWQKAIQDSSTVTIYFDKCGLVEPVPLHRLTRNQNAYSERGWCRAEVSWSSGRGDTAQHQRMDVEVTEREWTWEDDLTARTPVAPDVFAADMHSAAFTHRSDADAVIQLQEKVFLEKVTQRQKLKAVGISLEQMRPLTESLRHFKKLKCIALNDFRVGANEANAFVEALATTPVKKVSCWSHDRRSLTCLTKAILAAVVSSTLKITHLDLACKGDALGSECAEAVAVFLKSTKTLVDLDLSKQRFGNEGAKAVAEALKENRTLKRLNLERNAIQIEGVQALQQALQTNTTLEHLELDEDYDHEAVEAACRANPRICKPSAARSEANDGSDEGSQKSPFETKVRIKGLAELLRQNIVTRDFLDGLDDEQVKALADAIRVNKTMTRVSLDKNNFGNDGLKALAWAMEANETNREVRLIVEEDYLSPEEQQAQAHWLAMLSDEGRQAMQDIQRFCDRNTVKEVCRLFRNQKIKMMNLSDRVKELGDEHMKALADAIRVNKTVTAIDLSNTNVGDDGLKALADALRVNHTLTCIVLCGNNFGDEGVKALADALRVNKTLTDVALDDNNFGNEGLKALASAMDVNEAITNVCLGGLETLSDEGHQAMQDIERLCSRNEAR